jgi:hypothetical protein
MVTRAPDDRSGGGRRAEPSTTPMSWATCKSGGAEVAAARKIHAFCGGPSLALALCESATLRSFAMRAQVAFQDSRQKLIESRVVFVAVTTLVYAASVFVSEKISVGGGFGFDGAVYGEWARTFPAPLLDESVNRYCIQRIVPSALVNATLRLLRAELTPTHVIHAFEAWAIGLVCVAASIWVALARRLQLTVAARWFGAVALFGSYATLKWTAYYPVLTDLWSVVLALLQLLLFLDRRLVRLAVVTFIGAFVWPTSAVIGVALILFLPLRADAATVPVPLPGRLRFVPAGIAVVTWMFLCASILRSGYAISGTAPLCRPLLRLSLLASSAFLFCAVAVLVDDRALFNLRLLGRYLLRPHLLVAAAIVVAIEALQARLAPAPSHYPATELLRMIAYTSIQKPAAFLVAHVAFLGPVLLLLVMRGRAVMALARRSGPGLVVVAGLGAVLFLNSESRHLWNVAAMFIPFAVKLLDELSWTPRQFVGLSILTLASSNVWLTYEDPIWPDALQLPGQLFFMTNGPWMDFGPYVVQGVIVAGFGLWLARQLSAAGRLATRQGSSLAHEAARDRGSAGSRGSLGTPQVACDGAEQRHDEPEPRCA